MLPGHDHGGRVELIVTNLLAADLGIAGTEAVASVRIGAHSAGVVFDDDQFSSDSVSKVMAGAS